MTETQQRTFNRLRGRNTCRPTCLTNVSLRGKIAVNILALEFWKMHKIEIDQEDFIRAFGRDWEFHDVCPRNTYLDQEDGNVLFVY